MSAPMLLWSCTVCEPAASREIADTFSLADSISYFHDVKIINNVVGEFDGSGSLKTVYPGRNKLDTLDGRAVPSSSRAGEPDLPRQAALSDLQGNSNIADKSGNVNGRAFSASSRNASLDISQERPKTLGIQGYSIRYNKGNHERRALSERFACNGSAG